VSMKEYEIVRDKLRRDGLDWETAVSQAEELALNAQDLFGRLLSKEEIFSIAFLSGVRWEAKRRAKKTP